MPFTVLFFSLLFHSSQISISCIILLFQIRVFLQSDICHQSVYELVHSEDREELQRHLMWNSQLPSDRSALSLQEALLPGNAPSIHFVILRTCLRIIEKKRIATTISQRKGESVPIKLFVKLILFQR